MVQHGQSFLFSDVQLFYTKETLNAIKLTYIFEDKGIIETKVLYFRMEVLKSTVFGYTTNSSPYMFGASPIFAPIAGCSPLVIQCITIQLTIQRSKPSSCSQYSIILPMQSPDPHIAPI